MLNLVLMAGHGKRFSDAGYKVSKPLLPVSGEPMILRAVECMPSARKWLFVVRQEHVEEKELIVELKSVGSDVTVLVDPSPVGQLNSALVARTYMDTDESVFIGACDFGMNYDRERYNTLITSENAPDVISWSFTKQPNLVRNPQDWGWLKQDKEGIVHGVSVKVPISNDPYHDFAITGSFTFKSGKGFFELADELMRRDIRVKGEFYIDSILGLAVELGRSVASFPVKYIGWGTPVDYEEYLFWERVLANPGEFAEAQARPEYAFWKDYFSKTT